MYQDGVHQQVVFGCARVHSDNCSGCNVHLSFVFLKIINVNVIIIYIFLWKISPKYKLLCKL